MLDLKLDSYIRLQIPNRIKRLLLRETTRRLSLALAVGRRAGA
jgi:hypothetical protein